MREFFLRWDWAKALPKKDTEEELGQDETNDYQREEEVGTLDVKEVYTKPN